MIPNSGKIDVLITVKTSPQPSTKYKDTVCVAGLYLPRDGVPEHVRLYPVPFRHLTDDQKFGKYEIRTFDVALNPADNRPESRKVIFGDKVPLVSNLPPWKARADYVEQVERLTMCEINRAAVDGLPGPSLGLVNPTALLGIDIEENPPLSDEERAQRERVVSQQELDLFGEPQHEVRKALEPPPLKAWLRYRCADSKCRTHRQGILDWELTALQRRRQREGESLEQLRIDVKKNFFENPSKPDRVPSFFVGNQADPTKRRTFSVLGIYNPKRADLPPAVARLF